MNPLSYLPFYLLFVIGEVASEQPNQTPGIRCKPDELNTQYKHPFNGTDSITGAAIACDKDNGTASIYPCKNVDLMSFVNVSDLNNGWALVNDVWGWSKNGREIALMGMTTGTAFVEVTDPVNPIVLGKLGTYTENSLWRDIKTFQDYAYIVSEARNHGLQVFDLTELLRASTSSYTVFDTSVHYDEFSNAHNIFINEDSGFAYVVGSNTCNGGLHMIDINSPENPTFAGCFSEQGYTHDVQCVIYDGPDTNHTGKEICFASNEDKIDIIDVTSKTTPIKLSTFVYDNPGYVHQGWLTEDKRYFLVDDELDEFYGANTKTIVVDVSDLDSPIVASFYLSHLGVIDHNQYVKDDFIYQANYAAGLRILVPEDGDYTILGEQGYFDTYFWSDNWGSGGAWSNYPFFESGNVLISDIGKGLFVVKPNLDISNVDFNRSANLIPTPSPHFVGIFACIASHLENMMERLFKIIYY